MANYKIAVSEPSENDLRDIVRYISAQLSAPITALKMMDTIEEAIAGLSDIPKKYPLLSDDRLKAMDYRKPYQQFFKHKTFFIPHRMSIHNMLAFKYFSEMGLKPGVVGAGAVNMVFEVAAPVNMPAFLAETPNACGFMVAEPIGSRAVAAGIAEKQLLSSEIWDQHPCCVVVFREDFIKRNTDAVHEFTQMLVDSGEFIESHPQQSAEIAAAFLDPAKIIGLDPSLLLRVLTEPNGITTNNLYPVLDDLDDQVHFAGQNGGVAAAEDGRRIKEDEIVTLLEFGDHFLHLGGN